MILVHVREDGVAVTLCSVKVEGTVLTQDLANYLLTNRELTQDRYCPTCFERAEKQRLGLGFT